MTKQRGESCFQFAVFGSQFAVLILASQGAKLLPISQIPRHRLVKAGFKGVGKCPAEFSFDFSGVYRVAAIMAGAV